MTAAPSDGRPASDRSLVLVAGSGRSGTSLFSGTLQRLGYHVPQPEVKPDETNPRGFAESQWVVDFHTRLLREARVQVSDARPQAWAKTAAVGFGAAGQERLAAWLAGQFRENDHVIIKDPRLSWFLPLWRRCAEDLGVSPRFVTMLRHPAAVINSKHKWYGTWQGDVGRAAGWLNQMLFTERATREAPRVFVRYEDLLDDWTVLTSRVAEALELTPVRNASAAAIRTVHQFIDPQLSRSSPSWDDVKMPAYLRDQAEQVWDLLCVLADKDPSEAGSVSEQLDAARAAYVELYEDAEAIAQSSVNAAKNEASAKAPPKPVTKRATPSPARRLVRRIPKRYRRKLPHGLRAVALRVIGARPTTASR